MCCAPFVCSDNHEAGLPLLAGGEGYEFANFANLDSFFTRVYRCAVPPCLKPGVVAPMQGDSKLRAAAALLLATRSRCEGTEAIQGCMSVGFQSFQLPQDPGALMSMRTTLAGDMTPRRYWHERGLGNVLLSSALNLLALGFTIGFSAFLLLFVNWGALHAECIAKDTCDIMSVAINKEPFRSRGAPARLRGRAQRSACVHVHACSMRVRRHGTKNGTIVRAARCFF